MKSLLFKLSSILLLSLSAFANNEIYITQVGTSNNFTLDITQDGDDNVVNLSFSHDDNTVTIVQEGEDNYVGYTTAWGSGQSWGGDLDGSDNNLNIKQYCNQTVCGGDRFEFHISGNDNDVDFFQGYRVDADATLHQTDSFEAGGHFIRLDIHGSNNTYLGSQRSNNTGHEHTNTSNIYGSYNDVYARQEGNQDKTLTLTVNNSNNDIDIIQKSSAAHSATVTLSGSYATDLDLLQQGGTAQSYSLTQTCTNSSGCAVSVTQGI